jgi:GTPase SAR1 family protein
MSATSALRGYRTQFLYSLKRILSEYENGFIYQPEGKFEDLDILSQEGNYIEIIQVKNKTGQLVFSDLFSKETSFFNRADKATSKNENTKVTLVSFGEISEEIKDKEILTSKLKKKGFKENSIRRIIEKFTFEIVEEDTLTTQVLNLLKSTSLFSDPKVALELLVYWLYTLGEKSRSIQAKDLILTLERIGKFIAEQTAFNASYNNMIVPLSTKSVEYDDLEVFKSNFYYGVSAKFEHILYNLDIIRETKLNLIKNAFVDNNVVFIHGASGQGKSTLAYRYLKDYADENTVYELKISENLKEIYDIIASLEGLSKGLKFPITLYVDIKPQNTNWNEILKELYGKINLKFLITIREEDWNKSVNLDQYYSFKEVELIFDKSEAKIIYEHLSHYKTDLKFTDFEESWVKFGEKGLLLEYVYLINQGNTLKSRLKEQIQNIRTKVLERKTDELEILRFVCLSDSFNSTISFKRIAQHLEIKEPIKYVQDLQKEYLLQYSENKEYLLGLHPIRSKILCEILFDEDDYVDINNI